MSSIFNQVTLGASMAAAGGELVVMGMYLVIIIVIVVMMRNARKREKETQSMINGVEVGDSILTTSGFYGVVIDVMDEVVIVEFGNNKNCRITMKKEAIVEVEKAEK